MFPLNYYSPTVKWTLEEISFSIAIGNKVIHHGRTTISLKKCLKIIFLFVTVVLVNIARLNQKRSNNLTHISLDFSFSSVSKPVLSQ